MLRLKTFDVAGNLVVFQGRVDQNLAGQGVCGVQGHKDQGQDHTLHDVNSSGWLGCNTLATGAFPRTDDNLVQPVSGKRLDWRRVHAATGNVADTATPRQSTRPDCA